MDLLDPLALVVVAELEPVLAQTLVVSLGVEVEHACDTELADGPDTICVHGGLSDDDVLVSDHIVAEPTDEVSIVLLHLAIHDEYITCVHPLI